MPAGDGRIARQKTRAKIQKRADDRLAYLKAREEARAKGEKAPPDPNAEGRRRDPARRQIVGSDRASDQGVVAAGVRERRAQRHGRPREGEHRRGEEGSAPPDRSRVLAPAVDARHPDAAVRGAAQDRLHLQAAALHGAPDGRAAQPRVHLHVAAAARDPRDAAQMGRDVGARRRMAVRTCCAMRSGSGCRSISS